MLNRINTHLMGLRQSNAPYIQINTENILLKLLQLISILARNKSNKVLEKWNIPSQLHKLIKNFIIALETILRKWFKSISVAKANTLRE